MTDGPEKPEISFQPHQHHFPTVIRRSSIEYAVTSPRDHFVQVKATAKQGNRIACGFSFSSADNLFVIVRKREKQKEMDGG
jgi:hypothetical protein